MTLTIKDIKKKIEGADYDFLRSNEHLGDNICLLGLGGSYAYGLANENSDIDLRGVALNKPEEIIGYETFDNFRNDETDTVIYGINSFIKLLTDGNPNIVEILGLKEDQILEITPVGQKFSRIKIYFYLKKYITLSEDTR